jgi:chromosome segregation ATPase
MDHLNNYSHNNDLYYHSNNNVEIFEKENYKIQKEAKELIAKTRKMMEDLDLDKLKCNSTIISGNFETAPNNPPKSKNNRYSLSPNANRSYICDGYTNNNTNSNNIKNLQQKILEKSKDIKNLERQLKEKNSIIENLHLKVEKKNDEISKLNEVLMQERSSSIKVENSTLQRKISKKEKQLDENKKIYNNVVSEYKKKISDMMNFNDNSVKRIKELENDNEMLINDNKKLNYDLVELDKNLSLYKEKFDIEQKVKFNLQNNLQNLEEKVKILFNLLNNMKGNFFEKKKFEDKFFDKTKYFFKSENDYARSQNHINQSYSEFNQYKNAENLNDFEDMRNDYSFSNKQYQY